MEDLARRFFELDATRESLYSNVAMRGASHSMLGAKTIEGPFLLRRLSGVGGEPGIRWGGKPPDWSPADPL